MRQSVPKESSRKKQRNRFLLGFPVPPAKQEFCKTKGGNKHELSRNKIRSAQEIYRKRMRGLENLSSAQKDQKYVASTRQFVYVVNKSREFKNNLKYFILNVLLPIRRKNYTCHYISIVILMLNFRFYWRPLVVRPATGLRFYRRLWLADLLVYKFFWTTLLPNLKLPCIP